MGAGLFGTINGLAARALRGRLLPALLLACACIAVYANALHNTFLQDDVYNITQNTFIRDPANLPRLFTRDYFRLSQEGAYRPVPTAVLFLDHALFGYRVEGYRLVSLGWHIAAVVLAFLLLLKLLAPLLGEGRSRPAAFFAALLFAVHPVHSQMLSVISYHEDIICFVFMLAAMHLYLARRYLPALGAFALALFSKEMAVMLPAVLLLYHLFLAPRSPSAGPEAFSRVVDFRRYLPLAAFFALSGLFAVGRFTLFRPVGIIMESDASAIARLPSSAEFLGNAVNACITYVRYLGLLLWPAKLSVDWDSILIHAVVPPAAEPLALLLVAGMLWAAWAARRRLPWLSFGVLYFLTTLLPVSGVIPFWSSMAERYLYIPSLGIFLIAGCALERLWRAAARRGAGLRAIALLTLALPAALAWRTAARNLDLRDELTMYYRETADHPAAYGAWYGLGYALGQRGEYDKAKEAFLKADALDQYHKTHFMLGFVEEKLGGAPAVTEAEYKRAIELEPGYYPARFNLAAFYHKRGDLKNAIPQYEETLRINPGYKEAAANLGAAYLSDRRFETAAAALAAAREIRPELETPHTAGLQAKIEYNLAAALFNLDRTHEALAHYRAAIALAPELEKRPIMKLPPAAAGPAAAAPPAPAERTLLAELKKLYPGLKEKWENAEQLEYLKTPGGWRPRTGYKGSSQQLANLKPPEQAALEALAARDGAAEAVDIELPEKAGGRLALSFGGLRLEQALLGARAARGRVEDGLVVYRGGYPATDVLYTAGAGASEQLFFLRSPAAPAAFSSKVSLSSGSLRVESDGALAVYGPAGERRLQLSRPRIIDAKGKEVKGDWGVGAPSSADPAQGSTCTVTLAFDPAGLAYPLIVDPVWRTAGAGALSTARTQHTATLLPNGKVLVAGGIASAGAFVTAELYDPLTGAWSVTGSMATGRVYHTATLLPNGKLLVAGGSGGLSTELYDPATGTWSATGSLSSARTGHTATLLRNGTVLVTGGYNTITAEIYNPSAGTWSTTGSLSTGRYMHTATLLPDGRVLVAGSYLTATGTHLTAELYNPATGTWSVTGSMATARYTHTATLLPTGKVLVAGGVNNSGGVFLTAELYDPSAGTWSTTGSLSTARGTHSAVLLPNGKVLVMGGSNLTGTFFPTSELYDPSAGTWSYAGSLSTARRYYPATLLPNGKVLVVGGSTTPGNVYLSTAELYDPSAGSWSATGSMSTGRYSHTATLLPSGKVLIAGGYTGGFALPTTEIYDPAAGTWSVSGALSTARYGHTSTLLPKGKVLAVGGFNGSFYLPTSEIYDPSAGTWSATGRLSTMRLFHTATLLPNGKVLVAGGNNGTAYVSSTELYDPSAGTWSDTGSMSTARYMHTATLLPNGKVLAAGGSNGAPLLTAEVYDPATGTWSATGALSTARYMHSATLLPNGKVLAEGGYSGSVYLLTAELYNPAAGTWSATGSMSTARHSHTATLLPDGKVLAAGGSNGVGLLTAESYDPAAGTWSVSGALSTARYGHTSTLLPNGKVLLAGGEDPLGLLTAELARYTEYDYTTYASVMQPEIASFTKSISPAHSYLLAGWRFTAGYSQASGGGTNDSTGNYTRIYLQKMDTGNYAADSSVIRDISPSYYASDWSYADTYATYFAPPDLPQGYYLLTVISNAVPSDGKIVRCLHFSPYVTKVGSANNWKWNVAYSTDTVPSGTSNAWQWVIWEPDSGRQVPQGGADSWQWLAE